MSFHLFCVDCGHQHDNSAYRLYCDQCHGLLDVTYDAPATAEARIVPEALGTARFLPMLPIRDPSNLVTMGEGNTPVVPLPAVGKMLGLHSLYGKMEYFSPTGSFKDRGNTVQVSVLKDTGVTEVADPIGGNAGHSFAAYCARAGIKLYGFADVAKRESRKVHAIELHGVEMHWVGPGRTAQVEGARNFAEDKGILLMDYGTNIYFVEGLKTMAYEIAEQMDPLPDHIIVPVGNGSIYHGLFKGFQEMVADGRVSRMPKLHGVQTQETQPFVAAFEGREWTPPSGPPKSAAGGVSVPNPPRPQALVQAARESGGSAVAVSEEKILSWQRHLAALEGIILEPTSAVVLSAAEMLIADGRIRPGEPVLLPLTGFGLKEPIPGF